MEKKPNGWILLWCVRYEVSLLLLPYSCWIRGCFPWVLGCLPIATMIVERSLMWCLVTLVWLPQDDLVMGSWYLDLLRLERPGKSLYGIWVKPHQGRDQSAAGYDHWIPFFPPPLNPFLQIPCSLLHCPFLSLAGSPSRCSTPLTSNLTSALRKSLSKSRFPFSILLLPTLWQYPNSLKGLCVCVCVQVSSRLSLCGCRFFCVC
jgi:hypothetical protein